ncbi:MAG: tetratricopeptide repeat protein [Anaerolineae bacterium]|nr:tetratricopeptide repeat protein [Thermoflexales bacterium]MDW8408425.1 tetratricopeptide repeat protein [Anaerolineae bacterium]
MSNQRKPQRRGRRKKSKIGTWLSRWQARVVERFQKLAWADILPKRAGEEDGEGGDVNLTIKGSANRSIVVAGHNIYLQAPLLITLLVAIIAFAAIVGLIATSNIPPSTSITVPRFSAGSPYVLDLVVMPFLPYPANNPDCQVLATNLPIDLAASIEQSLADNRSQDQALLPNIKVWGPSQIKIEDQISEEEYAVQAQKLIADQGADIVLYATISCNDSQVMIAPHFNLAPSYLKDAPEFQGTYDLGALSSEILQPNDPIAGAVVQRELANRAASLAALAQGFAYLARHTYSGYLEASEVFAQITKLNPPPDRQTLSMAHLFAGNASLHAARGDCADSLNPSLLEQAIQHYQAALSFEPQTALAYLGLGNAMNQRALYEAENNAESAGAYLDAAETFFMRALMANIKPSATILANQVRYGRAQALLIRRDFTIDDAERAELLNKAEAIIVELLNEYRAGKIRSPSAPTLAAHAYLMMGKIHAMHQSYDAALFNLNSAQEIAQDSQTKAMIALDIAEIRNQISDFCRAAVYYQLAADNTRCENDKLNYTLAARDYQIACEANSSNPN